MSNPTYETINRIMFVTGSLDRAADTDFQKTLERYAEAVPAAERVVDMSNVHWMTPSGAKVLIQAGQESSEKGSKMRVLASRAVMQTLNLLGAKTWLNIESCLVPNDRPIEQAAAEAAAIAQAEAAAASQAAAATEPSGSKSGTQPLAESSEGLSRGSGLMRTLYINRRYNFCFPGGDQVMGTVRERVCGPWVIVESHGNRKVINLDLVQYCEIL